MTSTDGAREQLRQTFESIADQYHAARPEYPVDLFEELIERAGLVPGARLLEVGCGTGKATVGLTSRGFEITCIELGADLAAAARANLAGFPEVTVHQASFENYPNVGAQRPFDLVYAATAWHWIDPAIKYRRAWELLAPGGHLAFWMATHVIPVGGDPFFEELEEIYAEIGEGRNPDTVWHRPGNIPDEVAAIAASDLFDEIAVRQFDWEIIYDADSYIALLDSMSGHIAMIPSRRERLYAEIRRRLTERPDGLLSRHWGAALHVARAA